MIAAKDSRPKRSEVGKEKSLREKNKESVLRKKWLMNHLKIILILLLKNISSEIIHVDVVVNAINNEIPSISSQIFE